MSRPASMARNAPVWMLVAVVFGGLSAAYFYLQPKSPTSAILLGATASTQAVAPKATAVAAAPQAAPAGRRGPLTVVCVSDTHGLYATEGLIKVPAGDMLLFPGDVEVGSEEEGRAFSRWLDSLPVRGPRVLTWGNMDTGTRAAPANGAGLVPSATVIVNSIREINGYRIFASPWTPRFAGAYQLDQTGAELDAYWAALLPPDADVDIILTHGPPYGVADAARGKHRGDPGLLKAVQALKKPPLLWVCGHIHEQYGEHRVPHAGAPGGSILLINSAVYYVQKPEHADKAKPRVVKLPEAVVVPGK